MANKKKKFIIGGIVTALGATAGAIILSKKKKEKCQCKNEEKED